MNFRARRPTPPIWLFLAALWFVALACSRSAGQGEEPTWRVPGQAVPAQQPAGGPPTRTPFLPPTRIPGAPILTPTPDEPHRLPSARSEPEQYMVQPGDTLGTIAQRYGVTLEQLMAANDLGNPNLLDVGQVLTIPVADPQGQAPSFKIIPDSELVYGPAAIDFDIDGFVRSKGGYLAQYSEVVDEKSLSGAQVVKRVALDYSVNPRLLLAVLEYQSGWVTRNDMKEGKKEFPMGIREEWRAGLYRQLAWAANNLNRGYYLWRANAAATWLLGDGSVTPVNATVNAGTAGVQFMFAPLYGRTDWETALGEQGLFATYQALFGYPFDYAIEPLLPNGLRQPQMRLPFEDGVVWSFTGGPHGGWGDGSAWAAVDFAPPSDVLGCVQSNEWVVAAADGVIVRAADGVVMQDLDGDGFEQTGWVLFYMHIEARGRVESGAYIMAGERIGHPSCEGGVSTGTHVHLARKYNGEWIPADQTLPFVLDGWVSRGAGKEYDGFLERNGHSIEAWEGRVAQNEIQR